MFKNRFGFRRVLETKKNWLGICLALLHILCGLLFILQCTLNETLVRSDMQKHNYLCVDFCGAVWVMGPLVLRQGRGTRNLNLYLFLLGTEWGGRRKIVCLLWAPISWKEWAVKTAVSWRWWNKSRDQKKKCSGSCQGYQFPC